VRRGGVADGADDARGGGGALERVLWHQLRVAVPGYSWRSLG